MTTRCLSCMSELTSSSCPVCGTALGSLPDNQLYLPPGTTLNNRYLIGKVIGVGGFGVVYLGWDSNLDVRVAVKEFLPKDIAGRSNDHVSLIPYSDKGTDDLQFGIQKFMEEAKALAKFQDHPGIVKVSESLSANNTAYMIMQYLDGMTLKEYLKRQPGERMPFGMAIKALTPIMDALREVHKAGFVHRDISPDNIFITHHKQVKLLDFGAARYAMGENSKSLTSILKQGYAPMEQYSTKGNQGPWTDVYAVSATLYRCITGDIPPDSMERVQEECIRSPRQMGIDIPLQAELALMKGLALRAGERFENVEALQRSFNSTTLSSQKSGIKVVQQQIIQPKRQVSQNLIECPECGAKNQLNPGDNPNALRCGKCKRELGVRPVESRRPMHKPSNNSVAFRVSDQTALDMNTGLMWSLDANPAFNKLTWRDAQIWVSRFTLAGFNNWRLPTIIELEIIVNYATTNKICHLENKGFRNICPEGYWSSNRHDKYPDIAWNINMQDGKVYCGFDTTRLYVWPVRDYKSW